MNGPDVFLGLLVESGVKGAKKTTPPQKKQPTGVKYLLSQTYTTQNY